MTKKAEDIPQERVFKVGDTINHVFFGTGTVLGVAPESITVQFDRKYGKAEKTLLLKYNKKSIL